MIRSHTANIMISSGFTNTVPKQMPPSCHFVLQQYLLNFEIDFHVISITESRMKNKKVLQKYQSCKL